MSLACAQLYLLAFVRLIWGWVSDPEFNYNTHPLVPLCLSYPSCFLSRLTNHSITSFLPWHLNTGFNFINLPYLLTVFLSLASLLFHLCLFSHKQGDLVIWNVNMVCHATTQSCYCTETHSKSDCPTPGLFLVSSAQYLASLSTLPTIHLSLQF